jgi:hypothetical protein
MIVQEEIKSQGRGYLMGLLIVILGLLVISLSIGLFIFNNVIFGVATLFAGVVFIGWGSSFFIKTKIIINDNEITFYKKNKMLWKLKWSNIEKVNENIEKTFGVERYLIINSAKPGNYEIWARSIGNRKFDELLSIFQKYCKKNGILFQSNTLGS